MRRARPTAGVCRWKHMLGRGRGRAQQGFTIVELAMVLSISGIMLALGVPLFVLLIDTQTQSTQLYARQATATQVQERFQGIVALTPRSIGLLQEDGTINPLSIARDQVVLRSDGECIRIYYSQRLEQLRAARAFSCASANVKPVRGPNERDSAGNWLVVTDPSDPRYDPALDSADGSYMLADRIVPSPPDVAGSAGADTPLNVFEYQADNLTTVKVDARASSQAGVTHDPFYGQAKNRDRIAGIALTVYVAQDTGEEDRILGEISRQTAWLQRVTPRTASALSRRVDGATTNGSTLNVGASAVDQPVRIDGAGNNLASALLPSQNMWLEFRGAVTVSGNGNSGGVPSVRVQLYRNGVAVNDEAPFPRGSFSYSRGALGVNDTSTLRLAGAFRITGAGDAPTDTYEIRVLISNNGGGGYSYSTDLDREYLAYRVELPAVNDVGTP